MQIRVFKIITFFLLVFTGFFASAHDNPGKTYQLSTKNPAFIHETVNHNPYSPFNYESIITSVPVQINVQQHRTVHFWQVLNSGPNSYTISVRYLNLICGRGNHGLSRFRKLMLFPFHVFW